MICSLEDFELKIKIVMEITNFLSKYCDDFGRTTKHTLNELGVYTLFGCISMSKLDENTFLTELHMGDSIVIFRLDREKATEGIKDIYRRITDGTSSRSKKI
jgi:hypothetical protein